MREHIEMEDGLIAWEEEGRIKDGLLLGEIFCGTWKGRLRLYNWQRFLQIG